MLRRSQRSRQETDKDEDCFMRVHAVKLVLF